MADNLALLNALPLFHALGQPLAAGRQPQTHDRRAVERSARRSSGWAAASRWPMAGMNAGVQMLRVHDVAATVQARNVWRGLRDAALTDFSDLPD